MKSSIFNNTKLWPYLVFVISFLAYSNTLNHAYAIDDFSVIINHEHVQNGIEGIDEILSTNHLNGNLGFNDGLYRPLSLISFALEKEFFGNNPFVGHLLNLIFYGLANALLFLSLRMLFKDEKPLIPLLIVLLFAVHPLHTEVVANIKGRDDLYSYFGFALALWAFIKGLKSSKIKHIGLGIFAFVFALLSKESSILYLTLIPLFLFIRKDFELKKIVQVLIITSGLCVIFLFIRHEVIAGMTQPVDEGIKGILNNPIASTESPTLRWGSSFFLQLFFLFKLLFPIQLISDYSYQAIELNPMLSLRGIGGLILLLALVTLSIWGLFKRNKWGIIAAIYLMSIAIASQLLITIGTHFGERLLFFAVLPVSMAFVFGLKELLNRYAKKPISEKSFMLMALCPLLFFIPKTWQRNADWENNYSLYSADLEKSPKSARLNYNYGTESYQQGIAIANQQQKNRFFNEAVQKLSRAIEIYPEYYDAYNNLGLTLRLQGRYKESSQVIEQAIRINPNYNKYYLNLALNEYDAGEYQKAIDHFLLYQNRTQEQADLYLLMGKAAGHLGDFQQAINYIEYALQIQPNYLDALHFLGMANGQLAKHPQAKKYFYQALALDPNNTNILFALSISLHQLNELEEEQKVLQKILSIDPNHQGALGNINR